MEKIRKIAAVLLCVTMLIRVFCTPISASELSETAKAISLNERYVLDTAKETAFCHKVTAARAGDLKIHINAQNDSFDVLSLYVFDSKGCFVRYSSIDAFTLANRNVYAADHDSDNIHYIWAEFGKGVGDFDGTITYSVQKGTYYIKIETNYGNRVSFDASLSVPARIGCLSFSVKKGAAAQFGTVLSASAAESVMWSSSKPSVASVSPQGRITAKAVGTATITAKLGKGSMIIKIRVTA